jgi:hypothetical protein
LKDVLRRAPRRNDGKPASHPDREIVIQRIDGFVADVLALTEIVSRVERCARVPPLAPTLLDVVHEWVNIELGNLWIPTEVKAGVKQTGAGQQLISSE